MVRAREMRDFSSWSGTRSILPYVKLVVWGPLLSNTYRDPGGFSSASYWSRPACRRQRLKERILHSHPQTDRPDPEYCLQAGTRLGEEQTASLFTLGQKEVVLQA